MLFSSWAWYWELTGPAEGMGTGWTTGREFRAVIGAPWVKMASTCGRLEVDRLQCRVGYCKVLMYSIVLELYCLCAVY